MARGSRSRAGTIRPPTPRVRNGARIMTDQNELPDRFPRPAPETDEQRWRRIIASVHWPVTPEFATDQEWTDLVREGRKRRQRQRDFEESLRLDSNLPPPDPDLIV